MSEPVVKTIDVSCNPAQAFEIFVGKTASWWPLDKNSVSAMSGQVAKSVIIEPSVGGRVYEIGHDDEVHHWGSVKTYDPGRQLVLSWHIGLPASKATLVDVTFSETGAGKTRVVLTHSDWQVMGEDAEKMRQGYDSGWIGVFENAYRNACGD